MTAGRRDQSTLSPDIRPTQIIDHVLYSADATTINQHLSQLADRNHGNTQAFVELRGVNATQAFVVLHGVTAQRRKLSGRGQQLSLTGLTTLAARRRGDSIELPNI